LTLHAQAGKERLGRGNAMSELSRIIDAAWDDRASVNEQTTGEVREAVEHALEALDSGKARVAEKIMAIGSCING